MILSDSDGSSGAVAATAWRLRVSSMLLDAGLAGKASELLRALDRNTPGSPVILERLIQAEVAAGRPESAQDYEVALQRLLSERAAGEVVSHESLVALLISAGRLSELNLAIPRKAAQTLEALLSDREHIGPLIAACVEATKSHPSSVLITYAHAFALARLEEFAAANEVVQTAVAATVIATDPDAYLRVQGRFARILRMVDAVARDKMAWSAKAVLADNATSDIGGVEAGTLDSASDIAPSAVRASAVDTEVLLQARMQTAYLEACWANFEASNTLSEKLAAIRAMFRQGLRREPDYHDAYNQARRAYDLIRGSWRPLLAGSAKLDSVDASAGVRLLIQVNRLADELGFQDDAALSERALVRYLGQPENKAMLWVIAEALVRIRPDHAKRTALLIAGVGAPKKDHEIRSFLSWALHSRRHDMAHAFFEALPPAVKQSYAVYEYVRILQREGRFAKALTLCDDICATLIERPAQFDPWRHWTLIRRGDELRFLRDTARWFKSVPQPSHPKGVVMLAPRNAQQLTKYPLVVLMELKRQGWAVIPLVQGVLPREATGDPRIDKFIGCITQDGQLNPSIAANFIPIDDFVANLEKGRLAWAGVDMSQILWEEAAINRRRFSVDFTCPALQPFLGRLVNWTQVLGTVLHTACSELGRMQLNVGTVVSYQARLPDAIVRFYCAKRGDPQKFFCVHATNGYENYFANFSRHYSMKAGLRNVTAHPEIRTASFPVPRDFLAWYKDREAFGAANLASVQAVTRVRRAAREAPTPPPEALALRKRVQEWKRGGGRVACLFGKVVCDMGAPTDGGPAHANMKDWINHTVDSVRNSQTLLLIKPHPHEMRDEIATFMTERLTDLIVDDLPDNVIIAYPDWFDVSDISELVDLGVIYNGTTAIELGLVRVPAVLCSDFAPIDYPIGHVVPRDRNHYRKLLRFEEAASVPQDLAERAAAWIHYMSGERLAVPYRYHFRPLTNKLEDTPHWFEDDILNYLADGDPNVTALANRITKASHRAAA
ncbi:hypothetical protein EGY25_06340 [Brevundimonas intermedia]|uniref:Capsule polysaccharide biosynthesis protein n=1 Tax=Brevundimonas intermedia TaxID=74315 RepID=A0A4Y9S1Z7_9CAUL|nr:hypothetical protein [Brevundimonas intermedia]TFW13548.1 hypothetical protein EGY25_06340 [Brevundimonas intermedia]